MQFFLASSRCFVSHAVRETPVEFTLVSPSENLVNGLCETKMDGLGVIIISLAFVALIGLFLFAAYSGELYWVAGMAQW